MKTFQKHQLQHLEHYQFTSHLLTMAKEANVAKLTAVLKPLEDAFKDEDEAVFPQRGNAMNAQLRELDDRRDKAYYSLQHAVDAGLYSEEAAELEAAKRIDEIMKRYAGVATMNYDKETGGLKNLLTDLAETEAAKAVKVLHAEGAEKDLPKASSNKKHGAPDNSGGGHASGENPSAEHGSATVTPKP